MSYEQKPNSGVMFQNANKSGSQPDMRGELHIDKTFIIEQMNKANGPLVKIAVAGWQNTSKSGSEYLSMKVSEPYEAPEGSKTKNPWE